MPRRSTSARKDIFDELLKNWQTILPKLLNQHGKFNCPMTAEAVFNYLSSGKIAEARAVIPPDRTGECDESIPGTVASSRQLLKKADHGTHGVVTATNGEKEHSAKVLNVRGQVYLADAYNATPVFTQDLEGDLKWAAKLGVQLGLEDVHHTEGPDAHVP